MTGHSLWPCLVLAAVATTSGPPATAADNNDQAYVGRAACAACHPREAAAWTGSHHDLAMQEATDDTVLGDFDDRAFAHFGVASRFFRRDGRFMVRTDGPDGVLRDYPVAYTFGVYPLQQYLIPFPGGRLQALDIAWDSRPAEQGGQRWFHLHPEDPVRPDDPLHWTGPNLNWNYMCADCHSTNLRKNYDAGADSYDTRWAEIDVSCEACHGPGAGHVRWAQARATGEGPPQPDMGLAVLFRERAGVGWQQDPATGRLRRSAPRDTDTEIEVCARCHSRRSQLTDEVTPGQPFLDAFRPAVLVAGLYHADGQILEEVYEWGSFLQSRMYRAGVTCSDCHDPHSAQVRLPDDQVCSLCHPAQHYATPAHHHHPAESVGAGCLACHMPTTVYMGVDARHDHGMRVPRPDLSLSSGTPNACNGCHQDRTPQWAAEQVAGWYGARPQVAHYATALAAGRARARGAAADLMALVRDAEQPLIARATALAALGAYPDRRVPGELRRAVGSPQPMLRLAALDALELMGPGQNHLALPLLWDERRAVRVEAARLLAPVPRDSLPGQVQAKLDQEVAAYIEVQRFNAERPEAQVNLAGLFADLGRYEEAEQAFRKALALQPRFIPAYVNLAQLLATRGREGEAGDLLRAGLKRNPEFAVLEHALGLSLVRQGQPEAALDYLAQAAAHAPDVARYSYVLGVALASAGRRDEAIRVLTEAQGRHPGDRDLLTALVTYHRDAGDLNAARRYGTELRELLPGDAGVEQLLRQREAPGP